MTRNTVLEEEVTNYKVRRLRSGSPNYTDSHTHNSPSLLQKYMKTQIKKYQKEICRNDTMHY